jgi:hypothetical protein
MNNPNDNQNEGTESKGIRMDSFYQTVARVLVFLDEAEYTEDMKQDAVREHDALPDPASDFATREAK